jgi:hypothetical protein
VTGARRAAAALAALVMACPAGAQRGPRVVAGREGPDWRAGGTWVQQSRFLEDGNGVSVLGRTTLAAEVGPSWRLLAGGRFDLDVRAGVQLRVAAPRVEIRERADSIGPARSAGRAVLADVMVRVEQDGGGILQLHVAAGTVWMRGPTDLAPFRAKGVNGFHGAVEVGAALRVARRPLFLTAAVQAIDYASDGDPPVTRGAVGRAMLGVRHGR